MHVRARDQFGGPQHEAARLTVHPLSSEVTAFDRALSVSEAVLLTR